jgi:hypothetical protein
MVTMVCILFLFFHYFYLLIKGNSHRACIPSTLNWQFKINPLSSLYTLDVASGETFFFFPHKIDFFLNLVITFLGIFIETLENNEVRIERRLFASQQYTELLLAHVVLTRLVPKG